jgi:pyruvate dehydrogenase (quinone)
LINRIEFFQEDLRGNLMKVSDHLISRLLEWKVKRIFGYPGDGINGIIEALGKVGKKIEFVQVRHEEMAAFMACAHAKFTGEVGVCLATSGPGAIHLLNGLYDARMDHQPVVAIVGQQSSAALGGEYQQEVDLVSLFKDVARDYIQMCINPAQVRHLVDRAFRIAKSQRTVTCLVFPNDVQEMKAVLTPKHKHGTVHSSLAYTEVRMVPSKDDLLKAADVLNEGERVAILVGAGAKGASEEVIQVAELLGAGVAKALLGKDVLPDDLPFVTGAIGLIGTRPSWNLMDGCDTLLMVGTGFPYSEFLPEEGKAKGIQIDIDGKMLGIRYPTQINLQGDSKETLRALIPFLKRKDDRHWRKSIEEDNERWQKIMELRAMNDAEPVNPQRVFWEINKKLPSNCILSADSGSSAIWYARDIQIRKGMMSSLSGNLASMCPGVPYAIAAKFAYPDRVAIAFVGDGAMQMSGMNELITISKYWKDWINPQLIVVVLNNRDLNMVTWEQRLMGDLKYAPSQDVPDFPFANYARLIGLEGFMASSPGEVASQLEKVFAAKKPVVFEIVTDPNVPPLPPHISLEQAKDYVKAMFRGDPDSLHIIKQTFKEMADTYFTS